MTKVEPELVRVARIGPAAPSPTVRGPIAWNATHGARRDEAALFFTGDENLVELAGVVEYRYTAAAAAALLFGAATVEPTVAATSEGVFRESVGRTPLEDLLVADRRGFEADVQERLQARLDAAGLKVRIDRVRVVDAHPPREVVPAYRDASAAVSDAERYRNEAEAYAAEQHWSALAEAQGRRDAAATRAAQLKARAEGEQLGLPRPPVGARRAARPDRVPPALGHPGDRLRRPAQADPRPPRRRPPPRLARRPRPPRPRPGPAPGPAESVGRNLRIDEETRLTSEHRTHPSRIRPGGIRLVRTS